MDPIRSAKSIDDLNTQSNTLSIPEDEEVEMRGSKNVSDAQKEAAMMSRRRRSRSVCSADDLKKKSISRTPSTASSIMSNSHRRTISGTSKKVNFDNMSLILFICQHGDIEDDANLFNLRKATEDRSILSRLETGHQNLTPLHLACAYNQIKVVKFLLDECSVEVNNVDKEGWTPLHSACLEGHIEIVELLGRCQGRSGNENQDQSNKDWFFVADGPINLVPLNDDGESPEHLAADKKFDLVVKVMRGINIIKNLIKLDLTLKYPPNIVDIQLYEFGTDDSANETCSDVDFEYDDDSISTPTRSLGPLKRHKSTSAPKANQDRRKVNQNTKSDITSSGSSSNEDIVQESKVISNLLNESIKTAISMITEESPIDSKISNISQKDVILDNKRITSEEFKSLKTTSSKELHVESKSVENLKPESSAMIALNELKLRQSLSKESLYELKHVVIKPELNEAQKLASKESRSKRLSASRESLKLFEKKVQSLASASNSKDRISENNQQLHINVLHSFPTSEANNDTIDKTVSSKESSRTKSNILNTSIKDTFVSTPEVILKSPSIKRSDSFKLDMEVPKMSGKYTSDVNESRSSSLSISSASNAPGTTRLPNVYTVKLPQTRIRAATLSPTRQISFSSPNQNNSLVDNILSPKKSYTSTKSEAKLDLTPNIVHSNSFSNSSHIASTEQKIPFSVKSAISNITTNKIEMKPIPNSIPKIFNQDSISRIPTPVKPSFVKLNVESLILNLEKSADENLVKDTMVLENQPVKLSMMDRIRNFEKQAKK